MAKNTVKQAGEYVCNGKYFVKRVLKGGGDSHIYLATDVKYGQAYCIKEYVHNSSDDGTLHAGKLMQKLNHPAIPRIISIEQEGYTDYTVMEYVQGDNLLDIIILEEGGLPLDKAVNYMKQLCGAVGYLHEKTEGKPAILYRDMKPLNIIISPDGMVHLLDFDIAVELEEEETGEAEVSMAASEKNINRHPVGTPGYAAPELYRKGAKYDLRSDIFGLGATFYHMLTGTIPNRYVNCRGELENLPKVHDTKPDIPPEVDEIIDKALNTDMDKRYATVYELYQALCELPYC
jgi:serine/threonine-protein kinase